MEKGNLTFLINYVLLRKAAAIIVFLSTVATCLLHLKSHKDSNNLEFEIEDGTAIGVSSVLAILSLVQVGNGKHLREVWEVMVKEEMDFYYC